MYLKCVEIRLKSELLAPRECCHPSAVQEASIPEPLHRPPWTTSTEIGADRNFREALAGLFFSGFSGLRDSAPSSFLASSCCTSCATRSLDKCAMRRVESHTVSPPNSQDVLKKTGRFCASRR